MFDVILGRIFFVEPKKFYSKSRHQICMCKSARNLNEFAADKLSAPCKQQINSIILNMLIVRRPTIF